MLIGQSRNTTKEKGNEAKKRGKKRKCIIWLVEFFESVLGSNQTRFLLDDKRRRGKLHSVLNPYKSATYLLFRTNNPPNLLL